MIDVVDKIGVTRQHRWMPAEAQAKLLTDRCRVVVSLDKIDRDALVTLVREGTVVELAHAFLLADPRHKRHKGGMQADFRAALVRLEKRGVAAVVDVDGGICSQKHRRALLALVDADIARSNRGAKSAANGAKHRGHPTYTPGKAELAAAKAIWRDLIDHPEWDDADKALRSQVNKLFTAHRAYRLWRGRKPRQR